MIGALRGSATGLVAIGERPNDYSLVVVVDSAAVNLDARAAEHGHTCAPAACQVQPAQRDVSGVDDLNHARHRAVQARKIGVTYNQARLEVQLLDVWDEAGGANNAPVRTQTTRW